MTRTNNKKRKPVQNDDEIQQDKQSSRNTNKEALREDEEGRNEEEERRAREGEASLKKRFEEYRDQKLRQWYEESSSKVESIRAQAQSRLQLHLWIREKRIEIRELERQCKEYKGEDQDAHISDLRGSLSKCRGEVNGRISLVRKDIIPAASVVLACRKWAIKTPSLEEITGDRDLDYMYDFGFSRDTLAKSIEKCEETKDKDKDSKATQQPEKVNVRNINEIEIIKIEDSDEDEQMQALSVENAVDMQGDDENERMDIEKLEEQEHNLPVPTTDAVSTQRSDEDDNMEIDQHNEVEHSEMPFFDPTSIWIQHARHLQQRYHNTNIPFSVVETKLAFQKKVFDQHVYRENPATKTAPGALHPDTNDNRIVREELTPSWNAVLATSTFSEHNIWELTSPLLWQFFEHHRQWNSPGWFPRGFMRIRTTSSSSQVYFDFGARTFKSNTITLPHTVNTKMLMFPSKCHQTGKATILFGIKFLTRGFVKVLFPVRAIMDEENENRIAEHAKIELTGIWMGCVE